MTGIILAGGENRRMGADKAFLRISGKPMIERVLGALGGLFEKIIIVTNSPELYVAYRAAVVKDALDVRGPLTGIYTGMLHSDDEYHFVVACDMPFLNRGLISYMAGIAEGYDAVIPKIGELLEPLHAIYRRTLLPVIETRVRQDARRLAGIFDGAKVRYATEDEIDRFDPERRSFINLNTPKEYEEALCSDSECRS